jgi:hypothetical protein
MEGGVGVESSVIPEDAPRQDRYCLAGKRRSMHWGLCTTIEEMADDQDMRPSGSIEAWICSVCGHRENVIDSPEHLRADQERWEGEGGAPV